MNRQKSEDQNNRFAIKRTPAVAHFFLLITLFEILYKCDCKRKGLFTKLSLILVNDFKSSSNFE